MMLGDRELGDRIVPPPHASEKWSADNPVRYLSIVDQPEVGCLYDARQGAGGQDCPLCFYLMLYLTDLTFLTMSVFLDWNKGIQTHGDKLPHWQQGEAMQFVTFRLNDSMPAGKLSIWAQKRDLWLQWHPEPWDQKTSVEYHHKFTMQLEFWLDQGAGCCLFKEVKNRKILEDVMRYDQKGQAELLAWVIMPNHVHVLLIPKQQLSQIIKKWKGISARKIGKGSIWQRNYRDTIIRDMEHFGNVVRYIRRNPIDLPVGKYSLWESHKVKGFF